MQNRDSLQDTISRARDEFSEKTQVPKKQSGNQTRIPPAKTLATLAGIAVILALYKFVVVNGTSRQIVEDMGTSALDLFMEADASVVNYFMVTRELPESLPVIALRPFVSYERLDADRYTLTVNIPPHDNTIQRNAALISPPQDINALLNL